MSDPPTAVSYLYLFRHQAVHWQAVPAFVQLFADPYYPDPDLGLAPVRAQLELRAALAARADEPVAEVAPAD